MRGLNPKSLIQLLKTLPVNLTETYFCLSFFVILFLFLLDSFFFLIEIKLYLYTKFKKEKRTVIAMYTVKLFFFSTLLVLGCKFREC